MILNIILIFIFLALYQFIKIENVTLKSIIYFSISIVLFIICAFRNSGVDRDYEVYVSAFNGDNISTTIFEPSFIFITAIIKNYLNSNVKFLFVFYAILGLLLKAYAIKRISKFEILSLLLYVSYYFSLHEITQIRVGVACTFFLLSIPSLYNKSAIKYFSIITIATLFHFSAIILYPLWLLNSNKIEKNKWVLLLATSILFGLLLKGIFAKIFNNYSLGFFEQKILSYNVDNNAEYNVFNVWIFIKIFFILMIVNKIEHIHKFYPYIYLLVKIYFISIVFYYLFAFNPTFSSRITDILAITEILIFPTLIYIVRPSYVARFLIIIFGCTLLFLNLFYNKIIM